ncbi:MAG: C39 family peptidase [Prevotella sp.]|nr:C39 family peptidase [Prevotella sp.]
MANQVNNISDELLAAFMDGNTTIEETQMVLDAAAKDEDLQELIELSMQVDKDLDGMDLNLSSSRTRPLPMLEMAAKNTIDNLCVIKCEGYALRALGKSLTDEELAKVSEEKGWLQDEGTALHCIGQLSGYYGLYVSHRYDCSLDDIKDALENGDVVIAVIDNSELSLLPDFATKNDREYGEKPNHSIVITDMDIEKGVVTFFDPDQKEDNCKYPLETFVGAWNDSSNYLVIISNQSHYEPHPLNLDDVPLESELAELREAIAENAHEVWAKARKDEGWVYGPVRDDEKKLHPDMLPYNLLPEGEKEYDRLMAINTIKLVKKLGWDFVKRVK